METNTPASNPSAPHAPAPSPDARPSINEVLTAFFDSSEPIAQIADQLRMSVEQLAESLSNHARLIKRLTKVVELRARFKMFTAELVAVDTLKFIAEFDRDPERRRKASTKVLCHVAKYRLPPRRKPLKPSEPPQAPSRVRADILRSACGSSTPAPATSPSAATPPSAPQPSATPPSASVPHHDPMRETESPLQEAIRLESASAPQPATPEARADPIPTDTALLEPAPTEPASIELASIEPASIEPASIEPASIEPASIEPASIEPALTELASTEPVPTEPASTEPASIEPTTSAAPDESPFFAHDAASSADPFPPHDTARSRHPSNEDADESPSPNHTAPIPTAPIPTAPIPTAPIPIAPIPIAPISAMPPYEPPEPGIPIWPLRPPLHTCR